MRPPLFVYGSLRWDPLFTALVGPAPAAVTAVLPDHAVDRQDGNDWPMLVTRPGSRATGHVRAGLTADQWRRLDAFELPFGFDLRPVTLRWAEGGEGMALAYWPGPDIRSSGKPWQVQAWTDQQGRASLFAAEELAQHSPPLEGASMARQWPMVRMRAEARVRAALTPTIATLRHRAAPQDHDRTPARPLDGAFFKLSGMTLTHRRFDGTRSDPLPRETLVGADAALVLPYDPVRDRVLLVEQFRPGPARRGDPNPWSLEPVAHVALTALDRMFAIYASPGSTTDHFFCYLGLTDLPDDHPRAGGLPEEAEDLRLHLVAFDDAMALIDTGEAQAGPLVAMLLWLARHRSRIRAGIAIPGGRP
jgi:ADP-ribose pyrophosphatase